MEKARAIFRQETEGKLIADMILNDPVYTAHYSRWEAAVQKREVLLNSIKKADQQKRNES